MFGFHGIVDIISIKSGYYKIKKKSSYTTMIVHSHSMMVSGNSLQSAFF